MESLNKSEATLCSPRGEGSRLPSLAPPFATPRAQQRVREPDVSSGGLSPLGWLWDKVNQRKDSLLAPKLHLTSNDGIGNKEVNLILDCAPYNQGNKPATVRDSEKGYPWIAREDTSAKVTHLDSQRDIRPGSRGPDRQDVHPQSCAA